ncbi:four helix bundle protein [Mariniflexile sp.]|uniref:four helix bundle protein n=1 Tax=Mariniflexile sp. TaxID=1979402 RepID=UPI00404868DA
MASIKQFEGLKIWKLSRVLCDDINNLALKTDLRTDYKLYSQIDGSSGPVMDNVAEGFERNGNKEFIQFLSIAKASCGETRSQSYRVFDRNYATKEEFEKLKEQTLTLSKMIGSFMGYLQKSDFKGSTYNN